MNRITFLGFLLLAACVSATKFTDCGSAKGQVTSVDISGCPDSATVCTLTRGTTADVTINFTSKDETSSVKAVVHGVISGVPIPFPIPQPDGCKSGLACPIKNGQSYTYKNSFAVKTSYPPISVNVRYELKDQNSEDLVCVQIKSQLH